jgi:transposase InsO family protein
MLKLAHTEACFSLQVWLNLGDRWSTHQICSLHTSNTKHIAEKYAEIYVARVLCLHGVPKTIISDWGSQFVARFWEQLHASLRTHLIHSSAYHPQTDGQTERVNQILEDMLRACVMEYPGSWDKNPPCAEFSYNNSYQESLKMTPFEALYGR